ncbi:uncharacterized protein LOC125263166 isoform X2 [Megalobrama amblycephala]|uniref:uncharacterized protein LOC125263166 isoform X2 n=1 Tax=Megalobrama amblycephala TaxID=75352 RepID=UPI0020144A11|nr:uncharacterized protein LOC125263166 isoform X2 [Megalobrama amblycephala]
MYVKAVHTQSNCLFVSSGAFGDDVVTVSVKEGDSVTLNTGVTKQQHDKILWYFEDTRIALINGHANTSCLYDGEGGRFRDRLKVDYGTGSLTITDIRSEHAGRYEVEIIRSESSGKRQSLNRNRKCDSTKITRKISSTRDDSIKTFSVIITASLSSLSDQDETNEVPRMAKQEFDLNSGLSSAVLAGIVAVVLLLVCAVAATVIFYRHRSIKNGREKNRPYKEVDREEKKEIV